ncbi:hypothetical protein AX15_005876 [Amanita polypyramis BW_CC]|nr:hypothetical protein AX15_005876 [Amanita polypyramis BW_CC]
MRFSQSFGTLPKVEAKVQTSKGVPGKKRKLGYEDGVNSLVAVSKRAKRGAKNGEKKQTADNIGNDDEEARSESDLDDDRFTSEQDNSDNGKEDGKRASYDSSEDEEGGTFHPNKIVHESIRKSEKPHSKKKYVPPNETVAQRDLRTVFVGNLSVEVVKKRPLQKQLRRHLLSVVSTAKIESVRFRSLPFQNPTTNLSASSETPQNSHDKEGRERDRARAAAWRHRDDNGATERKEEKKFLTPSQKKKVAFINHEFHPTADTVHAYVVFAHPMPISLHSTSPSASPSPKPRQEVMDPYEAAQIVARQCDGTLFMDRLIHTDVVRKSSTGESAAEPKLTVFVGNLDFATKEEDLRVFFESMLSNERGGSPPKPEDKEKEKEENAENKVKKARTWVTHVRIVRDRETQVGKGFAYVQLVDRECVDEILALEEDKLKFAKRKLRVERCKTVPGSSVVTKHLTSDIHKRGKVKAQSRSKSDLQPESPGVKWGRTAPITIPKGDPKLGEKLANLSKEERKKAKAINADRVARRLAKKKAKMTMDAELKSHTKDGKKRVRVRKGAKDTDKAKTGKKKSRVRSEKSIAKLNAKK